MKSFNTDSFLFIDYTEMDEAMSRRVWECRNLPEIRKWMVNDSVIPASGHSAFVKSLDNSDKKRYFCILSGETFIGSINLTFTSGQEAERGLYLHPDFIGKGYAKRICREFYRYFRDNNGLTAITTKVKRTNVPSLMLERSLGALLEGEDAEFAYFTLRL